MARKRPNKPDKKRVDRREINMWAMIRDVLIASMNKGQLPIAGIILIILILVIKMPSKEAGQLIKNLIDLIAKGKILGYILFVCTGFGWFFHAKSQRRLIADEIERIGEEKSKLQHKLAPKLIESSEV